MLNELAVQNQEKIMQAKIARLNDEFRRNWFNPSFGTTLLTPGVRSLLKETSSLYELMQPVAIFSSFTEDNDHFCRISDYCLGGNQRRSDNDHFFRTHADDF